MIAVVGYVIAAWLAGSVIVGLLIGAIAKDRPAPTPIAQAVDHEQEIAA